MFTNYVKVAVRNILKYKTYSFINVFGLAVGMASSMLIMLYIFDELSYDRFQNDADRIFRIGSRGQFEGSEFKSAVSSAPVAGAMLREIPAVETATRFGWWRAMPMRYNDKSFIETRSLVADANFFQFFSFPLLSGNPATALKGTNKVVLTETSAKRFFGEENPVGKIIFRGEDRITTEVTGVVKDVPSNSHLQFDMIFSGETWPYLQNDHWSNTSLYTYVKLHSPADAAEVKVTLDELTEKNMGPELEAILGLSPQAFKAKGNSFGFFLQPLLDIHLKSDLESEITPHGNMQYIFIFGAVAAFLLLIACINFMNLSTARSATRAKEVGVRKSVGAGRSRLMGQFLSESMLYSFIATFLALAIMGLVLDPFNTLAGKNLQITWLLQPAALVALVIFALITGLIAGSYPAVYLTAFKPMDVLKGKVSAGQNSSLRNSLVVFQFMISIVLILGSLVVYRQLKYMQEINLGFDKENVIDVNNGWSLGDKVEAFKNELALHPEFRNTSLASGLPPHITDGNLFRKGGTQQDIDLHVVTVDAEHLAAMGYAMAAGRFFSADFPSDSMAIVLNETAYKQLGFDQIEGNTVINFNAETPVSFKLIGVIKDFNFENLRNPIKPMAMLLGGGQNNTMVRQANHSVAVRVAPGDVSKAIDTLERIWKKYSASPFEFTFLDQNIDAMFRSEQRMSKIVLIFTVLTMAIACLGLFGLATYMGEQRGKEISIRKVLGASVFQVLMLLLKDFTLLIGIAFVIAAPIGWYLIGHWLQEFVYHIDVSVWMILAAGISSLLIAVLTIGFQSIRVARENPVKSLKSE